MVTLRPFLPTDYPTFTALWNYAYPELKRTEMEMRLGDLSLNHQLRSLRRVAEDDGRAVGVAACEHLPDAMYHPRKFQIHVIVNQEDQRRGIGRTLYEEMMSGLEPLRPLSVRTWARQDRAGSVKFLTAFGFTEEMSTCHSSLDVNSYDLSKLEKYVERLARYGYAVKKFRELAADPERNRKLHELHCALMLDIPSPEPPSPPTLDDYEHRIQNDPKFFDTHLVAVHQGEYVGLCILKKGWSSKELYADTLGVRHNYRGRGIAQALSFSGISYARDHGYDLISAGNSIGNRRIIALLENLGFANRSVWTLFSKTVGTE